GGHGIMISSNNNLVQGNYVGLDASGTIAMAIATNGLYLYNAWYNTIGGSNATERNIFANCNNYGVLIENGGSKCRSNWLFNNYIGVDKNGNTSQSNNNTGVRIKGASYNFIGWTGANQGNVISSNKDCGVTLEGDCDSNTVAGNYIGLGANGTTVLVNGTSNSHHGIYVQGAGSTYTSIKNNVIVSPGRGAAIKFDNGGFDTLSANYCGTDYTGLVAVGAGTGSSDHVINFANGNVSNVTIVNNVVACGKGDGIRADGVCSNHVLKGNIVGMNKNGLGGTAFGNLGTGIYYSNGATKVNLIIGGVNASDRNIVSSNGRGAPNGCSSTIGYGIIIEQTNGATIQGNYIGVDASGNTAAGNGGSGIMINGGSNNILIGGTVVGARNIVCSNGFNCSGPPANVRHGIQFVSNGTATSMLVQGNYVGIGADGTTLLGNSEEAVSSWQTPNIIIGGNTPAYRNVIAGSDKGVFLQPSSSTGCKIIGNYIGTDASGTLARPNNIGVHIAGPAGTYIGGPNAGDGNLILFNNQHGIELDDADNTIIQQNYIQNNVGDGIRMQASSGNGTVGVLVGSPTNTALGNIISGNANGINIMDAPSQKNQIRRNSIFCNGTARQNGINLNGLGNINIDIDPLVSISPWITAPNPGITGTFTNQSPLAGTDVIEVFYDNACGTCQGKTYLGDATSLNSPAAGDWSFSPLPAGSDCSPKGGASCLVGVQNITATRTDNLGNTSEFMTCTPVVMPVTFLYIEAKRFSSDEVLIDWATATETNNAYFELMRSIDGTTFVPVGRIQGAGNSSVVNKYSFTDQNLSSGMYYYMLQQVDVDGKRSLSDIRSVNLGPNDNLIEIVPTSLAQGDLVKVLNLSGNQIISLTLTDMTGKILVENRSLKSTESSINTSGYASGMYVVRVETSSAVIVKKIFIY
ncbi:MAG: T9SS type A sorting domain-containing protein, partial [Cytophagaceae bacterium]